MDSKGVFTLLCDFFVCRSFGSLYTLYGCLRSLLSGLFDLWGLFHNKSPYCYNLCIIVNILTGVNKYYQLLTLYPYVVITF